VRLPWLPTPSAATTALADTPSPISATAAAECISDEALVHLKSYKYSAVDKSPVTHYVLMPWVCVLYTEACSGITAGFWSEPKAHARR
jgi:hypothetical protein